MSSFLRGDHASSVTDVISLMIYPLLLLLVINQNLPLSQVVEEEAEVVEKTEVTEEVEETEVAEVALELHMIASHTLKGLISRGFQVHLCRQYMMVYLLVHSEVELRERRALEEDHLEKEVEEGEEVVEIPELQNI